jgi:CTP:phosphocholine cytidylyltransferase-like protein
MNERILELYKQAHVPNIAIDPSNNMHYQTTSFSAEKFAQLIVKECGNYLMSDEFIGRSDLDWDIVLNEHFGVK